MRPHVLQPMHSEGNRDQQKVPQMQPVSDNRAALPKFPAQRTHFEAYNGEA